jgi:hypothetical protein
MPRYRVTKDCFYDQTYYAEGDVVSVAKGRPVYDYFEPLRPGEDEAGPEAPPRVQTPRDLLNEQVGVPEGKPWEGKH